MHPLREILVTAATRLDRVDRLVKTSADALMLDLEDAVPVSEKESARAVAREVVAALAGRGCESALYLRVNGVDTPWFADDVEGASASGLTGIVVPKVESIEQCRAVEEAFRARPGLLVMAGVESAAGVERLESLLETGVFSSVYFGAEDFVTDLGGVRTRDGFEVLYARSKVALNARTAGIPSLDQAVVAYQDADRFVEDATVGRSLGYGGKLCIHPAQVLLAHDLFTPSEEEVDYAKRLLRAFEEAGGDESGSGVAVFEGEMIDGPAVKRARDLVARASVS